MRQNLDMQTTLDSDNASTSGFVGKNLVVFGDFHGPSRTYRRKASSQLDL